MSKLQLPQVSLVTIETREHELGCLAIADCVRKVDFGEVLIFTDNKLKFSSLVNICNPKFVEVDDFPDKIGWSRCRWQDIAPCLATSHMLFCEWDAWVWDEIKMDGKLFGL